MCKCSSDAAKRALTLCSSIYQYNLILRLFSDWTRLSRSSWDFLYISEDNCHTFLSERYVFEAVLPFARKVLLKNFISTALRSRYRTHVIACRFYETPSPNLFCTPDSAQYYFIGGFALDCGSCLDRDNRPSYVHVSFRWNPCPCSNASSKWIGAQPRVGLQ